jgi:hypothetical protein
MKKIIDDTALRDKYKERAIPRSLDFDIREISKKYFDLF